MTVVRDLYPLPVPPNSVNVDTLRQAKLCRAVKARVMKQHHKDALEAEVVTALNSLYGGDYSFDSTEHQQSLAQTVALQHIHEVCEAAGAPTISASAALRELCGTSPGYSEPESRAKYQRGLVSLPTAAARVDSG